jgi:hypothetical protein
VVHPPGQTGPPEMDLGFLISWKKSQILPSQDFLFLGEHYRTYLGQIFPPEEKFQSQSFSHGSTILSTTGKAPHPWRLESVYRVREGTGWSKATPVKTFSLRVHQSRFPQRKNFSHFVRKFLFSATVLQSRLDNSLNYWVFWILWSMWFLFL